MKKVSMLLFVYVLFHSNVFSQKIWGIVAEQHILKIPNASIGLQHSADSGIVKLALTDSSGRFEFLNVKKGGYFIVISSVEYLTYVSKSFDITDKSNLDLGIIKLDKRSTSLKEIKITYQKPFIEVKADKTVVNVEGTVNAIGSDALQLLQKSPGVLLDQDNNLSLRGKNGVQVFIDGRPSPLTGKALGEYLKTISSDQIEAIELITNPSAKYEAAGNGGIINIRLKRNKSLGTNGSFEMGLNRGKHLKSNSGLSLNHRSKTLNIYALYNYNRSTDANTINIYRQIHDTIFDQNSKMLSKYQTSNYKAGIDYFKGRNVTLGLSVYGGVNNNSFDNKSTSPIIYSPTGTVSKTLIAQNNSFTTRQNIDYNANYRYLDTSGNLINIDLDHARFKFHSKQNQPNIYQDNLGYVVKKVTYFIESPSSINLYSLKVDFEKAIKTARLSYGAKISKVTSDNDFQPYDVQPNAKYLDSIRTNQFSYSEIIKAGYINYNKSYKKWILQTGVRVENTISKGASKGYVKDGGSYVAYDSLFSRPYTNFFPSAAITYSGNTNHQFGLTYSRRIDRPAYLDLNPFEFKLDEYTYHKGNINLRPQYTNSFGASYTYKSKLNTSFNYSHIKDVFTQLFDTTERSKSFIVKRNLATQNISSLNISYPFQYNAFNLFTSFNSYYSRYKADFGNGRIIDLNVLSYNLNAQSNVKFKSWLAEVSGMYSSPSIWQGTFRSKAMWAIDAGLQKQLFKGKGTLKVSVSDVFNTLHISANSNFAGQYVSLFGKGESRLVKLYFTYRLGSSQVKARRERATGVEEESRRTGN